MFRRVIFFVMALLVSNITSASVMNNWLVSESIEVIKPLYAGENDVNNDPYSLEMLFKESGVDIASLTPGSKESLLKWEDAEISKDGILIPYGITYLSTYLTVDSWSNIDLSIKTDLYFELFVDGKSQLKKGEIDSANLKLSQGTHAIIIKCYTEAKTGTILPEIECNHSNYRTSTSPQRTITITDVLNGKRVVDATISPKGDYLLYREVESLEGKKNYRYSIYNYDTKEILFSLSQHSKSITWKPNSNTISWLEDQNRGTAILTYNLENREHKKIAELDSLDNFKWSPTGDYLTYSVETDYSDKEWDLKPIYSMEDRQPNFRKRSQIFLYNISQRRSQRLTWGNRTNNVMDISPDGKELLLSNSKSDYTTYPFDRQTITLLNIETMESKVLWSDRLYSISAIFSPNGEQLLISGGPLAFGDLGKNIGKEKIANNYDSQLYIYNRSNEEVLPITKEFNPSVGNVAWYKSGIIFSAENEEYHSLYRYNTEIEEIETPADMVNGFSFSSQTDRGVIIGSKVSAPSTIYSITNLQNISEWSSPSKSQFKDITFGEVKDWDYKYSKETTIKGRYYLPPNFDKDKKYPVIVYYYGGTSPVGRSFGGRYPFNAFTAKGYIVYIMQPSGATGFGQEFSARHQNNWGKITGDEIISSTKAFIADHPFADGSNVGCMGASYGGFTTMYLLTQTDLFTCGISHAGISSISSYWGEGYWGYSYSTNASAGSYPWNNRELYVDRSPLFNADKINTPILLLHGTKDTNVPPGESIQLYTALKLLNREVDLIMIKDADHHVLEYNQVILWHNTILAYFDKQLKNQDEWWNNLHPAKNL